MTIDAQPGSYLVVACDGIYERMSNNEVAAAAYEEVKKHPGLCDFCWCLPGWLFWLKFGWHFFSIYYCYSCLWSRWSCWSCCRLGKYFALRHSCWTQCLIYILISSLSSYISSVQLCVICLCNVAVMIIWVPWSFTSKVVIPDFVWFVPVIVNSRFPPFDSDVIVNRGCPIQQGCDWISSWSSLLWCQQWSIQTSVLRWCC